jgi:ribosomal protein S18 acetylase RimI-like enzyme
MTQIMIDYMVATPETSYLAAEELQIVPAQRTDADAVVALFGALHSYNASLDAHFALSDDWEMLLRREFRATWQQADRLWLLVKQGDRAVGLLIAAVHTDSPMFRHRQWVEVEALYVASGYRRMGVAQRLLDQAYQWAEAQGLCRVQLYVTASNVRAQSVYTDQGFTMTQAIMRKSL